MTGVQTCALPISGAPGIPNPNPTAGMGETSTRYGTSTQASDAKIVNFNVYLHDVSDAQALLWAKKVEAHLTNKNEVSVIGGM